MKLFLKKLEGIWRPHEGQREFLVFPAKIKVLACGRRWGKTDACAVSILAALFQESPTQHIILAPTLDQATLLFDRVVSLLEALLDGTGTTFSVRNRGRRFRGSNGCVTFSKVRRKPRKANQEAFSPAGHLVGVVESSEAERACLPGEPTGTGAYLSEEKNAEKKTTRTPYPRLKFGVHSVVARSGHLGRSLRGNEATHIVVDEAAYVPEELITEVAMPMLATTSGSLTMMSTPRGFNHFWRFFQMGVEGENGVWSRRSPSSESPFVSKEFLKLQRELISERAYAVEYEAEFMDAEGAAFSTEAVEACLVARLPSEVREPFTIGVDWGRHEDFTSVAVLSGAKGHAMLVGIERFNRMTWAAMVARVARLVETYPNANVICDATGSGDGAIEQLRIALPKNRVEGFVFNSSSKAALIDSLAWAFERQSFVMEPNTELLRELQHFEARVSDSGNTKYGAKNGFHDDLVIALALAVCRMPGGGGSGVVTVGKRGF